MVAAAAEAETVDCIVTRDEEAFADREIEKFARTQFIKTSGFPVVPYAWHVISHM